MDAATGIALGTGITTVGGLITLILTQYYQARSAKADRDAVKKEVVVAADKVAEVVKVEANNTASELQKIHALVNGDLTKLKTKLTKVENLLSEANAHVARMQKTKPKRKR